MILGNSSIPGASVTETQSRGKPAAEKPAAVKASAVDVMAQPGALVVEANYRLGRSFSESWLEKAVVGKS